MKSRHAKTIGYFAYRPSTMYAFCDGDACIIAGSKESLKTYILKLASGKITDYHIKKTRYGEILNRKDSQSTSQLPCHGSFGDTVWT